MEVSTVDQQAAYATIKSSRYGETIVYFQGKDGNDIMSIRMSPRECKQLTLDLLGTLGLDKDLYKQVEEGI